MGNYDIALIGEAWGAEEERAGRPFVGMAGWQLDQLLKAAGIHRSQCHVTNVFNLRPKENNLENICSKEKAGGFVPIKPGWYLREEYFSEVQRLHKELRALRPNVAVLLGATAAWALLGRTGIAALRGSVCHSTFIPHLKCLPTYHPANVLYEPAHRWVTILDLRKAAKEAAFPEVRRPHRTVYIQPTLADLEWYYENHLRDAVRITFDIETAGDQITCIGFAPDARSALVVPFTDLRRTGGSYWASAADEVAAWAFVRQVLSNDTPKVAQNGLYDIHFLWRGYGIPVKGFQDDTMLLHHALQPESEKSLAFLGSIYTTESAWKLMRQRGKTTIKRDE